MARAATYLPTALTIRGAVPRSTPSATTLHSDDAHVRAVDIVAGDDGTALDDQIKLHGRPFPGDRGGSGSAERRAREEQKGGLSKGQTDPHERPLAQEACPEGGLTARAGALGRADLAESACGARWLSPEAMAPSWAIARSGAQGVRMHSQREAP